MHCRQRIEKKKSQTENTEAGAPRERRDKNAGWKPAAQNKKAPNRVGAQFVTVSNVAQEEIIVKEKKYGTVSI